MSGRSLLTRAASSSAAVTPIVLICAQTACGRIASSIPKSNATWFTAAASATMVMTTSASRTASGHHRPGQHRIAVTADPGHVAAVARGQRDGGQQRGADPGPDLAAGVDPPADEALVVSGHAPGAP